MLCTPDTIPCTHGILQDAQDSNLCKQDMMLFPWLNLFQKIYCVSKIYNHSDDKMFKEYVYWHIVIVYNISLEQKFGNTTIITKVSKTWVVHEFLVQHQPKLYRIHCVEWSVKGLIEIMYKYFNCLSVWQHPYVNVFKHLDVPSWKKATKEGEVNAIMVW
jgi:hypothetical protein